MFMTTAASLQVFLFDFGKEDAIINSTVSWTISPVADADRRSIPFRSRCYGTEQGINLMVFFPDLRAFVTGYRRGAVDKGIVLLGQIGGNEHRGNNGTVMVLSINL